MSGIIEKDYESVCIELDRLSILMLDAMKEYIDCKVLIENYIKTGSLHLAKARYIMGNKSVSSLQLPTEDCNVLAHTKVSHSDSKVGSTESLVFEIDRLSINQAKGSNGNVGSRGKSRKSDKFSEDNIEIKDDDDNIYDGGDESTNTSGKGLLSCKDPLKWFGVLVPQNLKYAQISFSTCLDHVVQCANLQMEMDAIHSKYTRLIQVKNNLSPSNK